MHHQIAQSLAIILPLAGMVSGSPHGLYKRGTANNTGCSDISFGGFEWGLTNFVFNSSVIFTTPAHQNSWGYVNFDVFNPAVAASTGGDSLAVCHAASSRINEFFYGDIPYSCTSDAADRRSTTFDFDLSTGLLRLNETWVCSDANPDFPTIFSASGGVKLSLECDTQSWTNPNWTIGDIYSSTITNCKPVDLSLKPEEMTAIA